MNVAATPEQITAAATSWLAVFTLLLVLGTAGLGVAAWRTYQITKTGLIGAKEDVDRQLAAVREQQRLSTEVQTARLRLATLSHLSELAEKISSFTAIADTYIQEQGTTVDDLASPNSSLRDAVWPLLTTYEHLALGVAVGAYDLGVTARLFGPQLLQDWDYYEPYINGLRRGTADYQAEPTVYEEFEWLVGQLRQSGTGGSTEPPPSNESDRGSG